MNIEKMTRKDFEAVEHRKWDQDIGKFDSLVFLPLRKLHDSGFRLMDFVAVKIGKPLYRLSGCSDVINLNGIGGYGYKWGGSGKGVPRAIPPVAWSFDCLKKSGLLRMFADSHDFIVEPALSSFVVYAIKEPEDNKNIVDLPF